MKKYYPLFLLLILDLAILFTFVLNAAEASISFIVVSIGLLIILGGFTVALAIRKILS